MVMAGARWIRDDFDQLGFRAHRERGRGHEGFCTSQYVNSPNYTAGFADLLHFCSWFYHGRLWALAGAVWSRLGLVSILVRRLVFRSGLWLDVHRSAQWGWLPYHYVADLLANVRLVLKPRSFGFGRP